MAPKSKVDIRSVPLADIIIDPNLQMRAAGLDASAVSEYAFAMREGVNFPPVTVFEVEGQLLLVDGFHRVEAATRAERTHIDIEVIQGTRRDAELFAVAANSKHGLRRTAADKRRAIVRLLSDEEWRGWSDREIAKACACDHKTVAKVRAELGGEFPTERTFKTRHGTEATMKVAARPAESGIGILDKMLAKVSDAALVAECQRRKIEVHHAP